MLQSGHPVRHLTCFVFPKMEKSQRTFMVDFKLTFPLNAGDVTLKMKVKKIGALNLIAEIVSGCNINRLQRRLIALELTV